jgi:phosphoesterase RecJ-like protein
MLSKLTDWFKSAKKILIIFHEFPDGDAIASSLALAASLRKIGKQADVVCRDIIPDVFKFLPGVNSIRQDFILADYDLVCAVDCGDIKRTGFAERIKIFASKKRKLINIDHHKRSDLHKLANLNYTDDNAAASVLLVEKIIKSLGVRIDRNMATLLLTGIYTDTGGFQHSNTCPKVYGLASQLLAHGAQLKKISYNISLNKKVSSLKLWGLVLTRARVNNCGIALSYITLNDIEKCGACHEDLAGVVNVINSIPESRLSILFTEVPDDKIKASIRTENNSVDVAKFAQYFGGGGHKKAAGFTIDGRIIESAGGSWGIE